MSSRVSLSLTLSLVSYSSTSSWALPASSIIQGQYQGHPTDYVNHEDPCLTLGPSLGHLDYLSYFHFYCQCHHLKRKKFIPIQSEDIISLQKKGHFLTVSTLFKHCYQMFIFAGLGTGPTLFSRSWVFVEKLGVLSKNFVEQDYGLKK